MRSFGIELAHEGIEAGLLLQAVAAGRAGFLLQGQVHALVAAILLRMAWLDARLKTEPMTAVQARARHREWLSDIEARIANIRATRTGEGRTFTPKDARALAGEWYHWYIAREANTWPVDVWEDYRDRMLEELQAAAIVNGVHAGNPLDLLESNQAIRERVRPVIADEAKSEQFLAAKRLVLNPVSRALFLDYVARDFFASLSLLARRARGDYGPDKWSEQFPQPSSLADASLTPWTLAGPSGAKTLCGQIGARIDSMSEDFLVA